MREGWYFTGHMGWVDAERDLWVAGRVDDTIISGGENIHPVEVEDVLARHAVVVFVVPAAAGLAAETLDRHCRTSGELASFKRPKTASGKILRRLLRGGQFTEVRP